MANYKIVDADQLDADLESVADAIRAKGETTGALAFPNGFVSAISEIEATATAKVATGEIMMDIYYDDADNVLIDDTTVTCGFKPDLVVIYVPASASTRYTQWAASFSEGSGGRTGIDIDCKMYTYKLFNMGITQEGNGFMLAFMDVTGYVYAYDVNPLRYYAVKYT